RGAVDRSTANGNGIQFRNWREFASSSNLHVDVFNLRNARARGVLVCNCPARGFASKTELPMYRCAVHLDYDAVNFIRQRLALFFPPTNKIPNLIEVVCQRASWIHLKTHVL